MVPVNYDRRFIFIKDDKKTPKQIERERIARMKLGGYYFDYVWYNIVGGDVKWKCGLGFLLL